MDNPPFSDFIVFVDESGDHGLESLDEDFPVFALVFCVISKHDYLNSLVPTFQEFKFSIWGHDQAILHEHDIRKNNGMFGLLRSSRTLREQFFMQLNEIMEGAPIKIIASVIDKKKLLKKYAVPFNPYELALRFCMERVLTYLIKQGETGKRLHVLLESRGKNEDAQLELEFRRICDNRCNWYYNDIDFKLLKFELLFVSKSSNSTGLQVADLIARPIALQYLRSQQENRAYEIIKGKVLAKKIFP